MNSLSWMIYGADVVTRTANILEITSISLLIGLVGINAGVAGYRANHNSETGYRMHQDDPYLSKKLDHGLVAPWVAVPALIGLLLSAAVPSRQTIYMIAASEMGQKVYETPATQELLSDLRDIVKKELTKMKEAES